MSDASRQESIAHTVLVGLAANQGRVRAQQAKLRAVENALGFRLEDSGDIPLSRKVGLYDALHLWVERCLQLSRAGLPDGVERQKILEQVFKVCLGADGLEAMELLAYWNQS